MKRTAAGRAYAIQPPMKTLRQRLLLLAICTAFVLPAGCTGVMDMPSDVTGRVGEIFTDSKAQALAKAAASGDVTRMARLLEQGVPVDTAGKFGITPAWWAIRNRNKEGFAWLLEHGASPNPPVEILSIMGMAAAYEDSAFLETALRYKPDINHYSKTSSPLHMAVSWGRRRNVELLIKAGVDLNPKDYLSPVVAAVGMARYDYALLLLQAGADPSKIIEKGPYAGQNELAVSISIDYINPDTDAYEWRERLIRYLKTKGIEAHPPAKERKRTLPLPDDLRTP